MKCSRTVLLLPSFLLLVCNLLVTWRAAPQGASGRADFKNLYTAAVIVRDGRAAELYRHDIQEAVQNALYPKPQPVFLPFVQPPYSALLMTPLAAFSPKVAYYIWGWGCNLLLALVSGWLLRDDVPAPYAALAPLLLLPVDLVLLLGQTTMIVLLALVVCFRALRGGKPVAAGLALALAMVKFNLTLPLLLWVILRKQWRMAGGTALGAGALAAVSLGIGGIRMWAGYVAVLRDHSRWFDCCVDPNRMPNMRGLVHLLSPSGAGWAWLLLGCATSMLVLFLLRLRMPSATEFAFLTPVSLFVSPHVNLPDLALLFLPLWLSPPLLKKFSSSHPGWRKSAVNLFSACR